MQLFKLIGNKMSRYGQVTMEAVVLSIIFAMAFLYMRGFFYRALKINWRSNIDSFSDEQYIPGVSDEHMVEVEGIPGAHPSGTIFFTNTIITSDRTGDENLYDRDGEVKKIPEWGTYEESED